MPADPFIGVDIRLTECDLSHTQLGDLDLIGDTDPLENIWQAAVLRLTTLRGKNFFVDKFGANTGAYVDEPLTDALGKELEADAKNSILEDPRIATVTLSATQGDNSTTLSITIVTATGKAKSGTVTI